MRDKMNQKIALKLAIYAEEIVHAVMVWYEIF